MPDLFHLDIYRGDTHEWTFTLWQDEAKTIPVDLTGLELEAEIRNAPSGATIIDLDCVAPIPTNGQIKVTLTAENARLVPVNGAWDLQITYPDGRVRTFVAGRVRNTLDVTDSTLP